MQHKHVKSTRQITDVDGRSIFVILTDLATNGPREKVELTLTLTKSTGIITTVAPRGDAGVPYVYDVLGDGGTEVFTWDNQSGGSSLGAGACTGLSIANATVGSFVVGRISGTPTSRCRS